jgi:DNA-binding NtrC family response regulator
MARKGGGRARLHLGSMHTCEMDLRLLLAEGDPGYRELIATALEDEGFLVAELSTLGTATDALRRIRFDLVLAECLLEDGSGLELISQARRWWPGTEGVLLSGAIDFDAELEGVLVLHKPFDLPRFLRAVAERAVAGRRNWLDRRKSSHRAGELNRLVEVVWRPRLDRLEARIARSEPGGTPRKLIRRHDAVEQRMRELEEAAKG